MEKVISVKSAAKRVRRRILELAMESEFHSHYGTSLSSTDIMATLFHHAMKYDVANPKWEERDRFFLSKGHCALGLYTILEDVGLIKKEELSETYQRDFTHLGSHPVMDIDKGIESSSGSLGHGLGLAIGSLLAGRQRKKNYRAFVLMGNGECNEGSVWEAAMLAAQCKLDNLVAIIDYNRDQGDGASDSIICLDPLDKKWESFGWNVRVVDGHNVEQLIETFDNMEKNGKPTMIVANTIKGKGVSFMEGNHEWHHAKTNQEQYDQAISEIENS